MLWRAETPAGSLELEGRVVDPGEGIDACLRITVEDGVITTLEPGGGRPSARGTGVRRPARASAHTGP